MSIFGGERDISVIRLLNRELMGDVVSQQCAIYKYNLGKTEVNIYGEADQGIFFNPPVLLYCLINRDDQRYEDNSFQRNIDFAFLRDDLVDAGVVPEIGDIIMYNESYYEVNEIITNQLFSGKDPQYPNNPNPLNPGLDKFGSNISIIVKTSNTSGDRLNINKNRL